MPVVDISTLFGREEKQETNLSRKNTPQKGRKKEKEKEKEKMKLIQNHPESSEYTLRT